MRLKGWRISYHVGRMSCDVGEVTKVGEWVSTFPSQLILQPFRRFTYVTANSPTLPLFHLRHSSFSNPFFASLTSQALHLRHLASRPWVYHVDLKYLYQTTSFLGESNVDLTQISTCWRRKSQERITLDNMYWDNLQKPNSKAPNGCGRQAIDLANAHSRAGAVIGKSTSKDDWLLAWSFNSLSGLLRNVIRETGNTSVQFTQTGPV